MIKEQNISKNILPRLLLMVALLVAAVAFDMYHDDSATLKVQTQEDSTQPSVEFAQFFYFNTSNSFKLTSRADRLFSCILFSANQDKFLSMFHNYRSFHLLKAETMVDRLPFHLMAHYMKFLSVQYSSPDDYHSFS